MADPSSGFDLNSLLQLLSGAGALGGSVAQAGAQNNSAGLAQQFAQATGQLNPFSVNGGVGATYDANGNTNLNYGPLQGAYNGLSGLAGQFGSAAGSGMPANVSGAGDYLSSLFGPNGQLTGPANSALTQAQTGLAGFNPSAAAGAANNAFLGAGNAASQAGSGFGDQVTQQFNALQALHKDSDTNAFNNLQSSLFGNGQLGASSGALQTTAFAKGLGQENAQDAANASQLGLQAQGQATNTAGVLGGLGNSLLQSAFSNFGNSTGLLASMGQGNLTAQQGLGLYTPQLQNANLQNSLGAISGAGAITGQGTSLANLGLQTSLGQNQASARAGSLSSTNANSPNQQSPYGQLLQSLFGGYLNSTTGGSAGGGVLNSLFGSATKGGQNSLLNQLFGGGNPDVGSIGLQDNNAANDLLNQYQQQPIDYGFNSAGGAAAGGAAGAGLGALLGGASAAAPAGSVGIYDLAGNLLTGGSSAAAGSSGAAAAGAAQGAGTSAAGSSAGSSAAGSGIGLAGGAVAGIALSQLVQGLLSGTGHPINSVADADSQAWTNDWLQNQSGIGLKGIMGDGGPSSTYVLGNGTQINGSQYQQLQSMTQKFIQGNNANNGALGSNKGLTPDQSKQLQAFISSVAAPSTAPAGFGSPTQSNLPDQSQNALFAAIQQQIASGFGNPFAQFAPG